MHENDFTGIPVLLVTPEKLLDALSQSPKYLTSRLELTLVKIINHLAFCETSLHWSETT